MAVVKTKKDRSRRSGNLQSASIQDFPGLHLTIQERAVWKFIQTAALLPSRDSDYYLLLPPSARMATDAVKQAARQLEQSIIQRKDK